SVAASLPASCAVVPPVPVLLEPPVPLSLEPPEPCVPPVPVLLEPPVPVLLEPPLPDPPPPASDASSFEVHAARPSAISEANRAGTSVDVRGVMCHLSSAVCAAAAKPRTTWAALTRSISQRLRRAYNPVMNTPNA